MPTTVVSLRVSEKQAKRLQRKARQLGRTPSETGAILLEESLRRDEFAFIDFRDSTVGRQAYIQGSRLAVWQVVSLARSYQGHAKKAADHLKWPEIKVQAALNYAKAFPEEIQDAIADSQSWDMTRLTKTLSQVEEFIAPAKPSKRK